MTPAVTHLEHLLEPLSVKELTLVTPHQAQVPQRLAAPGDLCGALIRDLLTPAGVHRLNSAAVLTDGDQSWTERDRESLNNH